MPGSAVRIRGDIDAYGWHVIKVPPDDEGPGFAYSIGLHQSFGHAEVIIFGLPLDVMHTMINTVGDEVRRGIRFDDESVSDRVLEGHPVRFRAVRPFHFDEYVGRAVDYYGGDDFAVLQCYWPDTNGHFPWQPGCSRIVVEAQPSLQAEDAGGSRA
jgi:Domain of unknown function (DUF4262)